MKIDRDPLGCDLQVDEYYPNIYSPRYRHEFQVVEKHYTSILDEVKRFIGFDIPPHTTIELQETWVGSVKGGLRERDDIGLTSDSKDKLERKGYEIDVADDYGGPDLEKGEMDDIVDITINTAIELVQNNQMIHARSQLRPLIWSVRTGIFRVGEGRNAREREIDDDFRLSILQQLQHLDEFSDESPVDRAVLAELEESIAQDDGKVVSD